MGHCEDQLLPKRVDHVPRNVASVTGGGGHTILLTESGDIYTCGSNNKGQLGLNATADVSVLSPVSLPSKSRVVMVTGGWDFSLAVTESHELYAWGSNAFGQLGDATSLNKCLTPTRVAADVQFVMVAAGLRHSVALTVDGEVYCWGHAKRGQCSVLVDDKPPQKIMSPCKVVFPLGTGRIKQVVAGSYHTAALSENGQLFVWGCNKYGQCTISPEVTAQVNAPHMVSPDLFEGEKVKVIQTGWTHFMAKTDSGVMYSWGRGDYGQLGRSRLPGAVYSYQPAHVDTQLKISEFVCGSEHTLFLSESGQLYSLGWNEHGLCATGDEVNVETVTLVKYYENQTVLKIACGGGHCFAVTAESADNG